MNINRSLFAALLVAGVAVSAHAQDGKMTAKPAPAKPASKMKATTKAAKPAAKAAAKPATKMKAAPAAAKKP